MSDSIIVTTQSGDVTVRKMPLIDYAELLKALDTIPKTLLSFFGDFEDDKLKAMTGMDFALILPGLLANSWGDLIGVVSVPTDKDADFMGKLDLADAVDIVAAILELNDLQRIIAAVKKMQGLQAKLTQPAKQKQT